MFAAPEARAHTPHDVIFDVELSPDFNEDHTAFAISRSYLLKSEDGGDTWYRLVRGLDHGAVLSSLEVSSQDKRVVYVGTRGDGVYRSVDGGRSWTKAVNKLTGANVLSLAVSPHSPDVVVAVIGLKGAPAVFRTLDGGQRWSLLPDAGASRVIAFGADDDQLMFSGDEEGQVRMSRDAGTTWRAVFAAPNGDGITDIAVSPTFSIDHAAFIGTQSEGIFETTDGGDSFVPLPAGTTSKRIVSILLSHSFRDDSTMWVSTWSDGVFISRDRGKTWSEQSDGLTTNKQADQLGRAHFGQLRSSGAAGGADPTMFVAGFDGLFRSTVAGGAWQEVETQVSSNIVSIAISPDYASDRTLAVATYINGAFLSTDAGRTWQAINNGLASQFEWTRAPDYVARLTGIGFSPAFREDRTLFAGIRGYVLRSEDEGRTWTANTPDGLLVRDEFPADYTIAAFSPQFAEDHTIVLGTDGGKVFRSTDGGSQFSLVGQLDAEVTAIVASPDFATDHTVVAGTPSGVDLSTDEGRTWHRSGDLKESVTSLAISPDFGQDRRIFAGTPSGLVTTTDGGDQWVRVVDSGLGDPGVIEAVVLSPNYASDRTALVSVKGRGLFRSVDGGSTFAAIGTDLLERNVVLSSFYHSTSEPIVFSPDFAHDQTVYGIAETSLLKSTDGGSTWEDVALPVTTHDTAAEAATSPLLPTAVYDGGVREAVDDRSFGTPIGRLSVRRVLAAAACGVVAFGALSLARKRPIGGRLPFRRLLVRVACSRLQRVAWSRSGCCPSLGSARSGVGCRSDGFWHALRARLWWSPPRCWRWQREAHPAATAAPAWTNRAGRDRVARARFVRGGVPRLW